MPQPVVATRKDIDAIVGVHLASFATFFLSFLGRRFLALYYRSVIEAPEGMLFVLRATDGGILGFVAGCTRPQGFYRRLLRQRWFGFGLAALPALLRKPSIFPRLLRALRHPGANPPGDEVAGLFSIGVDPQRQGGGVGRALVGCFLAEAKGRGCKQVFLTTDCDDNDAVNAFYRAQGFVLRRNFTTPEGRCMNEYWIDLL